MFIERASFTKEQVLERLMRKNTDYKNHMLSHLHKFAEDKKAKEESEDKAEKYLQCLYSYMTSIDYTQKWNSNEASFFGELTFTILD